MSYQIDYELDEFQPWPGLAIYAYGVATITYKWEGRDRDTGDDGGPYDIELQHLTISADKAKAPDYAIEQTDPLFERIEAILCASRDVDAACRADHAEE